MTNRCSIGVTLLLLAGGCGEVGADLDHPATLATISGLIRTADPESTPKQGVRVAIVWNTAESRAVAATAAVTAQFPTGFQLTIDKVPPPEVMMTADAGPWKPGTFGMAVGAIVAFEDRNGNGALDLASKGDARFVDSLAAVVENRLVFYSEGQPPPELAQELGFPVPRGFAIAVTGGKRGEFEGLLAFRPITEEISLTLRGSTADEWQFLMCQDLKSSNTIVTGDVTPAGGLPPMFPDPQDPGVRCGPDGSYVYEHCTVVRQEICGDRELDCPGTSYSPPDRNHPPAGWPCPPGP
jgi:hypothetical protein